MQKFVTTGGFKEDNLDTKVYLKVISTEDEYLHDMAYLYYLEVAT